MARVEDSPWAIPVAQIASRAGQSKPIDADFPAPSGIGDSIVGIKEGEPVHVSGQFDSIVDGLIFTGRLVAPFVSECTRCLKPIDEDWPVDVTVFFPYESGQDKANGKGGKSKKDDEIDIIAGEDESEDTYPLLENGAFADIEAMIVSHFFSSSAGIMPSQSTLSSVQLWPISAQTACAMSMSNPTIEPSGAVSENGGKAPSTQTLRARAGVAAAIHTPTARAQRLRFMRISCS